MQDFLVAGGSVPGYEHTLPGQPGWVSNHDAYHFVQGDDYLAAVVCDGCGTTAHPEVGAQIGASLASRYLSRALQNGEALDPDTLCSTLEGLKHFMVAHIGRLARSMDLLADGDQAVEDYFLFTIVGIVMDPKYTVVFSMGDGVWAVNGSIEKIGPFNDNAPPYLGNHIRTPQSNRPVSEFVVHSVMPTSEVQSVMIGSDGVNKLIKVEKEILPGKPHLVVGPVSQFWDDERFTSNPDTIRRRLALVGLEAIDMSTGMPRIRPGHLDDDTTLVVVRRKTKAEE